MLAFASKRRAEALHRFSIPRSTSAVPASNRRLVFAHPEFKPAPTTRCPFPARALASTAADAPFSHTESGSGRGARVNIPSIPRSAIWKWEHAQCRGKSAELDPPDLPGLRTFITCGEEYARKKSRRNAQDPQPGRDAAQFPDRRVNISGSASGIHQLAR